MYNLHIEIQLNIVYNEITKTKTKTRKEEIKMTEIKTLELRNTEHRQYLLGIAHTIRSISNGELYSLDGEMVSEVEMVSLVESGEHEEDDFEQVSIYDYLSDVLDATYYTTGRNGEYKGVRLLLAYGGPNVYLDTYSRTLELYWWNESATVDLLPDEAEEVDAMWSELYDCC